MTTATRVQISTNALPGAQPVNPPLVQNPQRDQLVLQNATQRITLQGDNGPVTFAVRIYRKNRQGQDVEHPLSHDLVARIEAAVRGQALSGAEIAQTQSLKLNFSRVRRNGAQPPEFNFTRLSRREIGRAAEVDVRVNAAFTARVPDLRAELTRCENAYIQRQQAQPAQNNNHQAQPGGQGQNPPHITLRDPTPAERTASAAARQRQEDEARLDREAQAARLAELQRAAARNAPNNAGNAAGVDDGMGLGLRQN